MIGTSKWECAVLEQGVENVFIIGYQEETPTYTKVFNKKHTDKLYLKDFLGETFPIFPESNEGSAPIGVDISQTYKPDYTQKIFSMKFLVTLVMRKFDMYNLVESWSEELGAAARLSYEYYGADIINNCTDTGAGYVLPDTKALIANDHKLSQAGTASNMPTAHINFSTSALEDALYYYRTIPDNNGYPTQRTTAGYVLTHPTNEPLVSKILNPGVGGYQPFEMSHTPQWVAGKVQPIYWEWMDDLNAWFVLPKKQKYLKCYESMSPDIEVTYATDGSRNQSVSCMMMNVFGASDWRHIYGSTGDT